MFQVFNNGEAGLKEIDVHAIRSANDDLCLSADALDSFTEQILESMADAFRDALKHKIKPRDVQFKGVIFIKS